MDRGYSEKKSRAMTYHLFFNPDLTIKELAELYDMQESSASRAIDRHFNDVKVILSRAEKPEIEYETITLSSAI